jgi:hypothetical protein
MTELQIKIMTVLYSFSFKFLPDLENVQIKSWHLKSFHIMHFHQVDLLELKK